MAFLRLTTGGKLKLVAGGALLLADSDEPDDNKGGGDWGYQQEIADERKRQRNARFIAVLVGSSIL